MKAATLLAVLALVTVACAPTWQRVDRGTLVASMSLLACDWGQTRSAATEGWGGGQWEGNLIMGERPSSSIVDAYFASTVVINAALWALLPRGWRSVVPGAVIGVQSYTVATNARTTRGVCGLR